MYLCDQLNSFVDPNEKLELTSLTVNDKPKIPKLRFQQPMSNTVAPNERNLAAVLGTSL